jgi:hypothetical protein
MMKRLLLVVSIVGVIAAGPPPVPTQNGGTGTGAPSTTGQIPISQADGSSTWTSIAGCNLSVGGFMLCNSTAGSVVNRSGSITAGGVAQTVMPPNQNRSGCNIQALGGSDLWVNISGTASPGTGSYDIPPGSVFVCTQPTPTGSISIFSAITGTPFTATELSQ